jgi:hypothetical protein
MTHIDNLRLRFGSLPVKYVEKRFDITEVIVQRFAMLIDMFAKQSNNVMTFNDPVLPFIWTFLYRVKDISWSYENEIRFTLHGIVEGEQYVSASPSKIFVGMGCSGDDAENLFEISKALGVPIYRMTKAAKNNSEFLIPKEITSIDDLNGLPMRE